MNPPETHKQDRYIITTTSPVKTHPKKRQSGTRVWEADRNPSVRKDEITFEFHLEMPSVLNHTAFLPLPNISD